MMTPKEEQHLEDIKLTFAALANIKYRAGHREHGGDLLDKTLPELLKEIQEELLDSWIYLQTAIEKIERETK